MCCICHGGGGIRGGGEREREREFFIYEGMYAILPPAFAHRERSNLVFYAQSTSAVTRERERERAQ